VSKHWLLAPFLALGIAAPAAALEVEGRYKATPEADCAGPDDAEGLIRIEDGIFSGIRSRCEMRNPVNVVGMNAQLFDMHCEGENETWTERALFMEGAEGGLILAWNGYAFRYERCPLPSEEPATEETRAEDASAEERPETAAD